MAKEKAANAAPRTPPLAELVKAKRTELRMSQYELAKAADLHREQITLIEQGTGLVPAWKIRTLANALDVSCISVLAAIEVTRAEREAAR